MRTCDICKREGTDVEGKEGGTIPKMCRACQRVFFGHLKEELTKVLAEHKQLSRNRP